MHHPDTRAELEHPLAEDPPRGFGPLPCPSCGEVGTIAVDLDDLALFTCNTCAGAFSPGDMEAIIAAWTPVLRWLDLAPAKE